MPMNNVEKRRRRAGRTRAQLARKSGGKLRLSVFRSGRNIAAQIIDDRAGLTKVSASSLETDFRAEKPVGNDVEAAAKIGKILAERAKEAGIEDVVFDRGGYIYHGRVKALAEAAREGGLKF